MSDYKTKQDQFQQPEKPAEPPKHLGLRGKIVLILVAGLFVIGTVTIWTLNTVGSNVADDLGTLVAERYVLWHKERVLGAVQRELALAKKMAESVILLQWAVSEDDPRVAEDARQELESFKNIFSAKTIFIALTKSKHYFYADEKSEKFELKITDTLRLKDPDDSWFFSTIESPAPFNLNVDYNQKNLVTNLWVNYSMRSGDKILGVVGTGIKLTHFIETFLSSNVPGVSTMLLDGGGAIQAHRDHTIIEKNNVVKLTSERSGIWRLLGSEKEKTDLRHLMERLKSAESESETIFLNISGKRLLVAVSYLKSLDWYSVAMMDTGAVVGPKEIFTIAAVLGVSLVILVVVFVIGQNIVILHPLLRLTKGAEQVARGNYDVRLPVKQQDEIGSLTGAFNDMASTIAEYMQTLEAKVEERAQQLRVSLDNMSDGMFMLDHGMKYVMFNEQYLDLLDIPDGIAKVGGSAVDVIRHHAERGDYGDGDVEGMVAERINALQSGKARTVEIALTNGRIIELRQNPTEGKGVIVVSTDITERKKVEEEIATKEAQLRLAMDNMPGGMFTVDKDLKFQLCNDQYRKLFDFPDDMITEGGPLTEMLRFQANRGDYGNADVNVLIEGMTARFTDGKQHTYERRLANGPTLEVHMSPIPAGGAVVVAADITDRKKAESLLQESEQRFKTVLDNMPAAVFLRNLEGEFVLVNQGYKDIYQVDEANFYGKTVHDLLPDEEADAYAAEDQEVLISGEVKEFETIVARGDESRILAAVKFPIYDLSGEAEAVGGIEIDITERKQAEIAIAEQKAIIDESIIYASRIQRSTLADKHLLDVAFSDHFVIWEPRDVVGGDIYWLLPEKDGYVLGVADCTGHGVPGAFLTLVSTSALRFAISENPDADPARLIASMNYFIKDVLAQYTDDAISDDGLELGVCRINTSTKSMTFSGARFSLWIVQDGAVQELKGDKTGIGYTNVPVRLELKNHTIQQVDGTSYYMFSDGFNDQVGGDRGRGFGKRRMLDLLVRHADQPMADQRDEILKAFAEFQGDELRRDDLTMVGFRL